MSGRRTECTSENIQILATAVRDGLNIIQACDLCEISDSTYQNWRNRGEKGEQPFVEFLDAIKKAKAERTQQRVSEISTCAKNGDWQANAWLEERQNRSEFGRNIIKVKLTAPDKSKPPIDQINDMAEELAHKLSRGEIDAEAYAQIMNGLEQRRKLIETSQIAKELAEIKAMLPEKA